MPTKPSSPRRLVTPEEVNQMVDLHREGLSNKEIGSRLGRGPEHVNKLLKLRGLSRPRSVLSEVSKEELERLYIFERLTLDQVGAKYGVSKYAVSAWLKKHGIPARDPKSAAQNRDNSIPDDEVDRMAAMYLQGMSSSDIAPIFGRNARVVRECLSRLGLSRSQKEGVRNAVSRGKIKTVGKTLKEDFFKVLTPESAWVLGLIFGDGHVMNFSDIGRYGVQLAGTKEVCEKVAQLINPSLRPRKMKDADCWILGWYSRAMIEDLEQYGLKGGNKARTIRMPQIPSNLIGHFLRGLWDADGCWVEPATTDQRLRTRILLASEGMIDDLQRLVGGHKDSGTTELLGKTYNFYRIDLRVDETERLVSLLYDDAESRLRCDRKAKQARRDGRR